MKKILIDANLKGKELYTFLVANKHLLINQKKSFIKQTDVIVSGPELLIVDKTGTLKTASEAPADATSVHVKVVGNACNYMDSQRDVLIRDSAKRSIQQRKGMIPHLADHNQKLSGQVGDVTDVYLEDISLRKLGLNKSGSTQCVIMESDVQRSYDERVFNLYKRNKVNQHSIGLQYVSLDLAINDEEHEKEIDFWNKYIDNVINREEAEELGYFWVVSEYKLLEISGVLFGANELTPTLETGKDHSEQPAKEEAPVLESDTFDLSAAIKTTKFFNFSTH